MNAKEIVQAWLDTPCEDPLSETDCLRLENIIESALAEAQADLETWRQMYSGSYQAGVALETKLAQARNVVQSIRDYLSVLQQRKWDIGQAPVEDGIRRLDVALAALDAGKQAV